MHRYIFHILFLFFLAASCVPEKTIFVSPTPVAKQASDIDYTSFKANWVPTLGVEDYFVEVSTDSAFGKMLPSYPVQTQENQKQISGLKDETDYFYRIRGIFRDRNTGYSNIIGVSTKSFKHISPKKLEVTQTGVTSFEIRWTNVKEADGYEVNLALDSAFKRPVSDYFQVDVGTQDILSFYGLIPETNYFVQVRSYKLSNGKKIYSAGSPSLSYKTLPPPPPEVKAPTEVTPLKFTGHWSGQQADSYLLYVSKTPDFSEMLPGFDGKEISTDSVKFTNLDIRSNYYYRLKAIVFGKKSDYSAIQKVESGIKKDCRIAEINFFSNSQTQTFYYDDKGRMEKFSYYSPLIGGQAMRTLSYNKEGKVIKAVAYRIDSADVFVDSVRFFYRPDGLLDSLHTTMQGGGVNRTKHFYDKHGKPIKYVVTGNLVKSTFPSLDTLLIEYNYTYNQKGQVIKVNGKEMGAYSNQYEVIGWEVRYDEKINPHVLLPPELIGFVSYAIPTGNNSSMTAFLSQNNPTYLKYSYSAEIIAYNYNTQEIAVEQLGYYDITYTLENCE